MARLFLRQGVTLVIAALAGSIVVFLLLRLLGGDAATIALGKGATPEALAELRSAWGLDRPLVTQYLEWMSGLVQGDLGRSFVAQYDIHAEIMSRLGLTVLIAGISLVLSCAIGLVVGIYAALHARDVRGGAIDLMAQLSIAVPSFYIGLLLILLVSIQLSWLPSGGYVPWSESPWQAVRSLILPIIAVSATTAAVFTRYVRSSMLEVLNEDYIRTAMARGRTLRRAAFVHGIRNASIPLITVATLQLGAVITGVVVVEMVFTLPGAGRLLLSAVAGREVLVVQSLAFVIIVLILVLHFAMDVVYGLLDPRVRRSEGAVTRG